MSSTLFEIKSIPELLVTPLDREWEQKYANLIKESGIKKFAPNVNVEVWTSDASNKALSYHTHGIFRYFGKFPPPIARHLISEYVSSGGMVIDPMCGSGTTALEALLLNKKAKCYDTNPLAVLISQVKTTPIKRSAALQSLDEILSLTKKSKIRSTSLIGLRNPEHWFLPETINSLSKIKDAINKIDIDPELKDLFTVAFLAIVRRVSRATTQQGRLFLDVETAEKDALPFFEKRAREIIEAISDLPRNGDITIEQRSILEDQGTPMDLADLIICHPPYFNSYKYSGVNSLELAWMNINHADIRKTEVREAFKVGKPEKVGEYVEDMKRGLLNLKGKLAKNGRLALMIGDTVIKERYIPVTKLLLEELKDDYKIERTALRIPKFTEASWAASQRRKGYQVGINLCDLIVVLKKT
jgi:site-specific DNA-methyltransferase (cytosine-N4-specific)